MTSTECEKNLIIIVYLYLLRIQEELGGLALLDSVMPYDVFVHIISDSIPEYVERRIDILWEARGSNPI